MVILAVTFFQKMLTQYFFSENRTQNMPRKPFLLHKYTFLGNLQVNTQPILLFFGFVSRKRLNTHKLSIYTIISHKFFILNLVQILGKGDTYLKKMENFF